MVYAEITTHEELEGVADVLASMLAEHLAINQPVNAGHGIAVRHRRGSTWTMATPARRDHRPACAGHPGGLNITITAEDIRDTHDILSRSNTSHCFRCLAPKPEPQPRGWGSLLLESFARGEVLRVLLPGLPTRRRGMAVRRRRRAWATSTTSTSADGYQKHPHRVGDHPRRPVHRKGRSHHQR